MLDEKVLYREPERKRAKDPKEEAEGEDEPENEKQLEQQKAYRCDPVKYPQWCILGLTKAQKRRLQCLRQRE